jgi:hypothetical protein
MSSSVIVQGMLKPDGTLQLDQKPNLPPGQVTVVLKSSVSPSLPQENWWQYMQRARRELEATGATFMNDVEMNAHLEWLREGDRIDDLLREANQQRQE